MWWPTEAYVLFLVVKNTNTTPVCSPSELTRGVLIVLWEETRGRLRWRGGVLYSARTEASGLIVVNIPSNNGKRAYVRAKKYTLCVCALLYFRSSWSLTHDHDNVGRCVPLRGG